MQPPLSDAARTGPTFHLIGRQPIRPGAVLLAIAVAVGGVLTVAYGLNHSRLAKPGQDGGNTARSTEKSNAAKPEPEEKDDPNQVDTIVLGDAADAPVPAHRPGRASNVHATILVHLPRYGDSVGLIPDTPSGHLLYQWLAAFNQASSPAMANILPNVAVGVTVPEQMELRRQTGGFNLLSAKEIQPGILVFRLRDQTPLSTEVLGTLWVRPDSKPPAIASFSLRAVDATHSAVPSPAKDAGTP